MRDTLLGPYEDIPRSVVVTANDYPASSVFTAHTHRRAQFAYAASGTISMYTSRGNWVVPPARACWIPAGVVHEMRLRGPVTMLNTFVSTETAKEKSLPDDCCVMGVSPLLHNLITEAIDLPSHYDLDGRQGKIMGLLVEEIAVMPKLSLNAPLPADARLARLCRALLDKPSLQVGIDEMANSLNMSRRSFTRFFRAQTGVGFAQWRQQACLLSAVARLGGGENVTRVALDLGYGSPSAFTASFQRMLGMPPSRYFKKWPGEH
ncbi:helix-turn-helix transcriptional regulator [Trinickia terrae]|uniref:Helix-turn-helix transcriptional regulator n=1 Tax=Trinickia terrae TaxID=2571161 RepID=A0A4U1I3N7_9BURK|nr:helix-turn-helix transcriptional regulator [Trinickia terrae]TKC87854.1 helix-turn-helix transcriptional regulator [Trinickia terrae]